MSKKIVDRLQDPLEDRGWQQMKVLLDLEMPEKKKRLLWWPWISAAAAVVLVLTGTLYFRYYEPFPDSTLSTNLTQDQRLEAAKDVLDDVAGMGSTEDKENVIVKIDKSTDTAGPVGKALQPPTTRQAMTISTDLNLITNHIEAEGQSDLSDGSTDKVIDVYPLVPDHASREQRGITFSLTSLGPVDHTLQRPYRLSELDLINSQRVDAESLVIKHKASFDMHAASGFLMDNTLTKPSFDLGANLRYKPIRKMAIGVGAYFWSIQGAQRYATVVSRSNALDDRQDLSLISTEKNIFQANDTLSTSGTGSIYYVGDVDRMTYVRIPLFVQFFPGGRWQPYLGMNQMILLSGATNSPVEIADFQPNFATGSSIRPIEDLLRITNTSLLLGLTYQSPKHIGFDLSYARSRNSFLNYQVSQGDFFEYHHYVRLSLNYRF